jgi:opacity protein-like surface antigen
MIGDHMEVRMKRFAMVLVVMVAGGVGSVSAQTPDASTATEGHPWYGELAAAATFGHKSSGSVGFEGGYRINDEWQVFIEIGRMSNVATAALDQRAQNFFIPLGSTSVSTAQRAVYADAGVRYQLPPFGMWHPYGLVGLGFASVKTSTAFSPLPNDVTVSLGNDLNSTLTKLFLTVGGGVRMPFKERYLVDISYRYGRIFPKTSQIQDDTGINTNRIQAGIGVRF